MATVTFSQKQYGVLLKRQAAVQNEIMRLKKIMKELAQDEVQPSVLKRLNARSLDIEKGAGKKFSNIKAFKQYLRAL